MGTGVAFLGSKAVGSTVEPSPPYTTKVKNEWSYNSTPSLAFMVFTRNTQFNNTLLHKNSPYDVPTQV